MKCKVAEQDLLSLSRPNWVKEEQLGLCNRQKRALLLTGKGQKSSKRTETFSYQKLLLLSIPCHLIKSKCIYWDKCERKSHHTNTRVNEILTAVWESFAFLGFVPFYSWHSSPIHLSKNLRQGLYLDYNFSCVAINKRSDTIKDEYLRRNCIFRWDQLDLKQICIPLLGYIIYPDISAFKRVNFSAVWAILWDLYLAVKLLSYSSHSK